MNEAEAREEILALMQRLEARPVHVRHVTDLTLQIFDQLQPLHGLGPRERLLLEAAAALHDIGHQSTPPGAGHHKESARLIRAHPWKFFTPDTVEIIAQVARYHRRSMPELNHEEFRRLSAPDRGIVLSLAASLRLGDSLDRSHQQQIRSVTLELPLNQIVFHLETTGPVLREVKAARQKGDLAIAVFQRDLIFRVGHEDVTLPSPSQDPG